MTNGTTYTYEDASPDPNGVTYNVSEDDLFPPGYTPVTLLAVDAFNNSDSCLFYVENIRRSDETLIYEDYESSSDIAILSDVTINYWKNLQMLCDMLQNAIGFFGRCNSP